MGLLDKRQKKHSLFNANKNAEYGILLVDDEMENIRALTGFLQDKYFVCYAKNAQEALTILTNEEESKNIHIIISDQRMPGSSGIELLAECMKIRPQIKRILLTGYTDLDVVVESINKAQIYKYLRKPVDINDCLLTIERACEAWTLEQEKQELSQSLQYAYERLTLLDADKINFLKYLSHELSAPLQWVSASQLFDREALSDESLKLLGFIDQGLTRLRGLVTAVSRYFQVIGLDQKINQEMLDLKLLINEQNHFFQEKFAQVRLFINDFNDVRFVSDFDLVFELFRHIFENAFRHAEKCKHIPAEVTVSVQIQEHDFTVSVHNSGQGLSARQLKYIMQPFLFSGSAHNEDGYGLSIATARAIAIALGGDLDAISTGESDGVTFLIKLPHKMIEHKKPRISERLEFLP